MLRATRKVVLISGTTSGVGGAGAAKIILTKRKAQLLEELSKAVRKLSFSTKVLAIPLDVTSEALVEALLETAYASFD
ncbi:MAG: hypothetical protein M1818_004892 [Claussenomyces sp. TS43310]|nr:MAG: hypothetical protein M1818_004892 [Claussenomyces sp. TS43310]